MPVRARAHDFPRRLTVSIQLFFPLVLVYEKLGKPHAAERAVFCRALCQIVIQRTRTLAGVGLARLLACTCAFLELWPSYYADQHCNFSIRLGSWAICAARNFIVRVCIYRALDWGRNVLR